MNYLIHGINCCTLRDINRYSLGRDPVLDGPVRLQTELLAYEPLVLIPEPLCPRDRSRDGSGISQRAALTPYVY